MNYQGLAAFILSGAVFLLVRRRIAARSTRLRLVLLAVFGLLSLPAVWFASYYLHVFPESEWLYAIRAWPGSEYLAILPGFAAGVLATFLPRRFSLLPLPVVLVLAGVPHVKPLLRPLAYDDLRDSHPRGSGCMQSTASTCGPCSLATILRHFSIAASERSVARAAYTSQGGTEAWYLARVARYAGMRVRFAIRDGFDHEIGLPAVVGVRLGSAGHFIAVMKILDGKVSYSDPLIGDREVALDEFRRAYVFTGFHMVVQPAQ